MANEEKILEMLGTMQEDLTRVNDRLGRLETTQARMEQDLTGVKAHLEVEIDRDIKLLAEGHAGIIEKLKKLDELEETLEKTSVKVDAIHAATLENIRDISALKRAR